MGKKRYSSGRAFFRGPGNFISWLTDPVAPRRFAGPDSKYLFCHERILFLDNLKTYIKRL